MPLLLFVLLICPPGLGFIYLWEGYPLVLCGAQVFSALLLVLIYRAGINSARKNHASLAEVGGMVYLPLKVNLVLYFLVGIPVIWFYAANAMVLMIAYGAGCLGFCFAYLSGLTFMARSVKP